VVFIFSILTPFTAMPDMSKQILCVRTIVQS